MATMKLLVKISALILAVGDAKAASSPWADRAVMAIDAALKAYAPAQTLGQQLIQVNASTGGVTVTTGDELQAAVAIGATITLAANILLSSTITMSLVSGVTVSPSHFKYPDCNRCPDARRISRCYSCHCVTPAQRCRLQNRRWRHASLFHDLSFFRSHHERPHDHQLPRQ